MEEKTEKTEKVKKPKKQKKEKGLKKSRFRNFLFYIVKAIMFFPRILIYPVKIIHKKRLPKHKKHIVVSNHLSWTDSVHIVFSLPRRRFILAKKELSRSWFLRFFRRLLGIIFIDRENPSLESFRTIYKILKRDEAISIYAEGTRNKVNRELQEIKSGAASFSIKSGAPIIPVMIYSKSRVFRRNYLYVGEPFDLNEFAGKKMTHELTAEADAKVRAHMLKAMEEMDDYVLNKRWKRKNRLPPGECSMPDESGDDERIADNETNNE